MAAREPPAPTPREVREFDRVHAALTRFAIQAPSLEALAARLAELIGRSVAILDDAFELLACSGTRLEATPSERRVCDSVARHGADQRAALFDGGVQSDDQVWTQTPDAWRIGAGVASPVRLDDDDRGWVWVLSFDGPLTWVDRRATAHMALMVALYYGHRRNLTRVEERYRKGFFDSLLEGSVETTPQTLERAKMLRFSPDGRYRVGVFALAEDASGQASWLSHRERVASRVQAWLDTIDGPRLVTEALNQVAFLLPETTTPHEAWHAAGHDDVSLVTSRFHTGFGGVRRAYEEVRASLPHARPGLPMTYEELLLPRVMQGDPNAQTAFVDAFTAPLLADRSGTKLVDTLFALARTGFRLNDTARDLDIHISTLRHRMDRIRSVGQIDLDDPQTQFQIRIAQYLSRLM